MRRRLTLVITKENRLLTFICSQEWEDEDLVTREIVTGPIMPDEEKRHAFTAGIQIVSHMMMRLIACKIREEEVAAGDQNFDTCFSRAKDSRV